MKNRIKKRKLLTGLLFLSWAAASCDDVIEPDLSDKHVTLLAPADSTRSITVVQTFRWEAVKGARQYLIRIGGPSLAKPSAFFLDSLVNQSSFTGLLAPGHYQWQVQAVNAGYSTVPSSRSLQIDSTGTLNGQVLQLLLPVDNSVNRGGRITLAWTALPMAQRYILQVTPSPRGGTQALDTLLNSSTTSVQLSIPSRNQTYQWNVTALNATSLTNSPVRRFEADVLAPPAPTLVAPIAAASFLALPITLSWSRNALDATLDSVFVYEANQTRLVAGFPRLSTTTSIELNPTTSPMVTGTYYWAVRSVDRAGNSSPLSVKRQVILQ